MPKESVQNQFTTVRSLTVVAHRFKVQADQIWQQECIALRVPRAIADVHRVGVVHT